MTLAAHLAVLLVALIHVYIVVLEMVLWDKPLGMKVFRMSAEQAAATKVLAANQGLYNGFLAAGLLTGLVLGGEVGRSFELYFLACVLVAGLYGAATVSVRILFVQSVPAAVGLGLVLLAGA